MQQVTDGLTALALPLLRGLVVGRLVGGFGIGSCAIVVPVYLAEVAPTSHRGSMVQAYEVGGE